MQATLRALSIQGAMLELGSGALYVIPEGWGSVIVEEPTVDPVNGLSSNPDAVDGVICVWGNLQGLDSVTVNADLSYSVVESVPGAGGSFAFYFIDPTTGDTGTTATETIPGSVVPPASDAVAAARLRIVLGLGV